MPPSSRRACQVARPRSVAMLSWGGLLYDLGDLSRRRGFGSSGQQEAAVQGWQRLVRRARR
eukprot:12149558-Alexandrium_andersonii.AAC.1